MNDKELGELIELLYPFFVKKMKSDGTFKSCIKSTNASVTWVDTSTITTNDGENKQVSNIGKMVKIKFPYDTTEIEVINKSTAELSAGDLVCIHYCIDLKNAYVAYKV